MRGVVVLQKLSWNHFNFPTCAIFYITNKECSNNSLFGPKCCRFYSEEEMALAYLICEIRLCGGLIDGFSMEELDYIAIFVSPV